MDYAQGIRWLYARQPQGIHLGLDRVGRLLDAMGRPQDAFEAFHVAGTNGKGSTAALIEAVLRHEGYRTALYLSPHVSRFTERIQIGGLPLSEEEVARCLALARLAMDALPNGGDDLTFFEIVTAAAFEAFRRTDTEVAVVEVGLGGRLDATNLVRPVATVVTNVGHDHLDRLGGSVEAAAREKAGILKPGVPCVTASQGSALQVIRAAADKAGAPLRPVSPREVRSLMETADATTFQAEAWGRMRRFRVGLLGRHQAMNALTAVRALESSSRFRVLPESAEEALAHVSMPGRLERIASIPTVLLDGAHNPDAAVALVGFIERVFPQRPIRLVFGCLGDKDVDAMLAAWARLSPTVACPPVPNARARNPAETSACARALGLESSEASDVPAALSHIMEGPDDAVGVVTGSLFLVGAVRRRVLGIPDDLVDAVVTQ